MSLFAGDIEELLNACRKANAAHVDNNDDKRDEWLTHALVVARQPEKPASCVAWRPPPSHVRWLSVERVPDASAQAAEPMAVLVSALAAIGMTTTFVVASDGVRAPMLTVGIEADEVTSAWMRSLLAPGVLMRPCSPPRWWSSEERSGQVGAVFRLLAPAEARREEGDRETRTTVSTLERLLALPPGPWAVTLRAEPAASSAVTAYTTSLTECTDLLAGQVSTSKEYGSFTSTRTNGRVEHLQRWVSALTEQALDAAATGGWQVSAYALSPDATLRDLCVGALLAGPSGGAVGHARWLGFRPRASESSDSPPLSFLSSAELVGMLQLPASSTPGLQVVPPPPQGRRRLAVSRTIRLGRWSGVDDPLEIDCDDLSGHAFVCGVTGSGKSTTIRRLLADAWNVHGIPFLVIDPVKADYGDMGRMLGSDLLVVDANDLHLNILAPHGQTDPRLHLELVANVFKGSFSFPTPTPYLLSQLFELMVDRAEASPYPTLHELHDLVDGFVSSLGYGAEIEGNIRAAMSTRLKTLLTPAKAERVASRSSFGLSRLFDRPAVVQLAGMGDDAERAFVMSMLALYVREDAASRRSPPRVAHITVLEEAHRIMPEPSEHVDDESGDPRSVAARLMTDMLAEVRSAGEVIVVADQSPSQVARNVLRNTNLKIVHRILDADDRAIVAGSIGLDEEQGACISRLGPGEVLVSTTRLIEPQAAVVTDPAETAGVSPPSRAIAAPFAWSRPSEARLRPCCDGLDQRAHHLSERYSADAEYVMAIYVAGRVVGDRDPENLRAWCRGRLGRVMERHPGSAADCLAWTGLRRVFARHGALGLVSASDVGGHLHAAYTEWVGAARAAGDWAGEVRRSALRVEHRPFDGCDACGHGCYARVLGAGGLDGSARQLTAATARARADDVPAVIAVWLVNERHRLAEVLGDGAAMSAAVCGAVHVVDGYGLEETAFWDAIAAASPAP